MKTAKPTCNVRAAEGRVVHFPQSIRSAPGRKTFVLSGDVVIEVNRDERFIMKRIQAGDLVVVKTERQVVKPMPKRKPTANTEES